jgi:hypothetical protein
VQDLQQEEKEEGMNLDFVSPFPHLLLLLLLLLPSFLPSFLFACFVVVAHSSNVTNFFGRLIT